MRTGMETLYNFKGLYPVNIPCQSTPLHEGSVNSQEDTTNENTYSNTEVYEIIFIQSITGRNKVFPYPSKYL